MSTNTNSSRRVGHKFKKPGRENAVRNLSPEQRRRLAYQKMLQSILGFAAAIYELVTCEKAPRAFEVLNENWVDSNR